MDLSSLSDEDRRYVLDRMARELAEVQFRSLDLMYPEMVAALTKCDVRTLESKGLERVEIGPKNIRYRRSEVEKFLDLNTKVPTPAKKNAKR